MLITNLKQFDNFVNVVGKTGVGDGESLFLYQELPECEARIELRDGGTEICFYFNNGTDIVESSLKNVKGVNLGKEIRKDENVKELLNDFFCDFIVKVGRGEDPTEPMDEFYVDEFSKKYNLSSAEKKFVNIFEANI